MSSDNPWQMDAKCANDPVVQNELLDGTDRFHDMKDNNEWIKRYCKNGCPVLNECFEYAMDMLKRSKEEGDRRLYPFGVWGGTSQNDRAMILKRQRRTEVKILELVERMKAPVRDTEGPIAS